MALKPIQIGARFGKRTVIGFVGYNPKTERTHWLTQCDCGFEGPVAGHLLRRGKSKACRACTYKTLGLKQRRSPSVVARNCIIAVYRVAARNRGISWELDTASVDRLISAPCTYCGRVGTTKKKGHYGNPDFFYTGIDRRDNTKGYTTENSVPCCGRCNSWKSDLTETEFLQHAKQIAEKIDGRCSGNNAR